MTDSEVKKKKAVEKLKKRLNGFHLSRKERGRIEVLLEEVFDAGMDFQSLNTPPEPPWAYEPVSPQGAD